MQYRGLTSSEPHYFVVLNTAPLDDQVLLLAVASSQIEKVRKRQKMRDLPEHTVVEIAETDYQDFTKDCCIDCNKVFIKPLAELCQQFTRKEVKAKQDIPPVILEQLIQGTLDSPLVSKEDKARINPIR